MAFTVLHSTGWFIDVLDSAMNHVPELEVRGFLESQEVRQAIIAASANGDILHWTGTPGYGEIVLQNGVKILIRHGSPAPGEPGPGLAVGQALLVVFHVDRGDKYRGENLQTMHKRFSEGGGYRERMLARKT